MKKLLLLIGIIVFHSTMYAQNSFILENFSPAQNIWYTWQPNVFNASTIDPSNQNETVGFLLPSSNEEYGSVTARIIDTLGLQNTLESGSQTLRFRMRVDNPHATAKTIRIRLYAEPDPAQPNYWGNHMYVDVTPTVYEEWATYSVDLSAQYSSNLLYNKISIEPSPGIAWNESIYVDDIRFTQPDPTFEIVRAYSSEDGTKICAKFNYSFDIETDFTELQFRNNGTLISIESFEINPDNTNILIAHITEPITSSDQLQLSYTTGTLRSGLLLPLQNFDITIANLVNISTISGWRDDFNSDSDAITNNISILPVAATTHGEVATGDGYYSVSFNGATGWYPLLITTISDVPEESKNVIDLSGQEFIKLRYRIAPNAVSQTCSLRVDLKDKTNDRMSDNMMFIPLQLSSEWTEIVIDLQDCLENLYGSSPGKVDQGTIYQVALYFAEKQGDAASAYVPTLFNGTIEFDYIELGGEVPAPVIENITESLLFGGSSYTLEVTDSINGGLITWYSDAELTNVVGYGNSLTTELKFQGDNIRYAIRTIGEEYSSPATITVKVECSPYMPILVINDTLKMSIPYYKKVFTLQVISPYYQWTVNGEPAGEGELFNKIINNGDTFYNIKAKYPNSNSICGDILANSELNCEVTITYELPFVNTLDTTIYLAIGEEKDLVFKNNNQYMCNTWNSSNTESQAIDTVAIDYFPNLFIIDQESEYTIVTIKGIQDGTDTLEWYRTTNCTPDGTVKRFVVVVGNGIPAPVIENITESLLFGGSSYTLEVTDSINGGVITWYSDAELTNIVGYGNSLTTQLILKGDNIRYATRTIGDKISIISTITVDYGCVDDVNLPSPDQIQTIYVPYYKKQFIIQAISNEYQWTVNGQSGGDGDIFTKTIDKADTIYNISAEIPYSNSLFICENMAVKSELYWKVIITNELPFVNTIDTVIHIAIGEEKDLVIKNICGNSVLATNETLDVVTIKKEIINYTTVTIKGIQNGVDTLEWYNSQNCTYNDTNQRFVVVVGNGTIDTCPKIEFSKLDYAICEPATTLLNQSLQYVITEAVPEVYAVDTIYPRGQVLSIGKQNARMYVVFNNGCSVHVEDTIIVTQHAKPTTPIVENYIFEIPQAQLLQAVLADKCTGQWIIQNNELQYYQDSKNLWLETDHAIGEYVHAVVAIDTLSKCVSDTAFSYVKIVSPTAPSISGTVSANGTPVTIGVVQLFVKNGNEYKPAGITEISENGTFEFKYLDPAVYIVRALAIPDYNEMITNYLPTYYYSTTNWTEAFQINLIGTVQGIDITVIEISTSISASGEISGNIVNNDNTDGFNDIYKEFTLFQVPVYAMQNGTIVGCGISDSDGNYTITNLPQGTYQVFIDIPGYAYTKEIVYLGEAGKAQVNFIVKNGEIALDLDNNISSNTIAVYPNPTANNISIAGEYYSAHVLIFDAAGNKVHSTTMLENIDVSQLPQGVYTIQIIHAAGIQSHLFIKE